MNHQHIIQEFEDYMLSEKTLRRCLIKQQTTPKISEYRNLNEKEKDHVLKSNPIKDKIIPKEKIFIPKQKDTLFWCFYIMTYGEANYEMLHPINLIVEKKWKIEYIEKIRQNKNLLKQHKYATLVHIENQLLNEEKIDLKTFFSLCVLENLNIFYINKKTYYDLSMNESKDEIFILRHHYENKGKYGFEKANEEILQNDRKSLFKIENFEKPLKAMSSYKNQELIDFCIRLGLEIVNQDTKKPKKKQDLYECLVQYF